MRAYLRPGYHWWTRTVLLRLLAGVAAVAAVAGCGEPAAELVRGSPPCRPADEQAGLIAERLSNGATELRRAMAVRLEPPVGQYAFVVAAEVQGEVGVWAVGPWIGGVRIMGLDAVAHRWTDWGTAISSGSAAGEQRSRLASRPEAAAVRSCVRQERVGPDRLSGAILRA